jgi:putative membrane protein
VIGGIWFALLNPHRQNASSDRLDTGSKLMLGSPDIAFAMRAAQNDLAEVRLGKLAAVKAGDPDVRVFGKQMMDDHIKASDQLKAAAQQENMTLPDVVSVNDRTTYDRLTKLSGSAFDKTYLERMLKDQQAELKEARREATSGKDPNIRDLASQMVLTLQDHLDRIKMIQSKIGIPR